MAEKEWRGRIMEREKRNGDSFIMHWVHGVFRAAAAQGYRVA